MTDTDYSDAGRCDEFLDAMVDLWDSRPARAFEAIGGSNSGVQLAELCEVMIEELQELATELRLGGAGVQRLMSESAP